MRQHTNIHPSVLLFLTASFVPSEENSITEMLFMMSKGVVKDWLVLPSLNTRHP